MLYHKLAYKNVRASFHDYLLYFLTLALTVSLFYCFNASGTLQLLSDLDDLPASIPQLLDTLSEMMHTLSAVVTVILAVLVLYANRIFILRRSAEFALYYVLGMRQRHLTLVLMLEALYVALLALGAGLLMGILFSQIICTFTASLFITHVEYHFVFSPMALVLTLAAFCAIFFITASVNVLLLPRRSLSSQPPRPKQRRRRNRRLSFLLPLAAFLCFVSGALLLLSEVTRMRFLIALLLLALANGLLLCALCTDLPRLLKKSRSFCYRGLHLLSLRQLYQQIRTNIVSFTILSCMLTVGITFLFSGLCISNNLNSEVDSLTPYSFSLIHRYELGGSTDPFDWRSFSDEIERLRPATDTISYERTLHTFRSEFTYDKLCELLEENHIYIPWELAMLEDAPIEVIPLSAYNQLCRDKGLEEIRLKGGEALLYSSNSRFSATIHELRARHPHIMLYARSIRILPSVPQPLRPSTVGESSPEDAAVLVVSDGMIPVHARSYADYWNVELSANASTREFALLVDEQMADPDDPLSMYHVYTANRDESHENSIGSSVLFTYVSLYIGIILIISAGIILALKLLAPLYNDARSHALLEKLGTPQRMHRQALFVQTLICFAIPLILAIADSILILKALSTILYEFGKGSYGLTFVQCALIILFLYAGYFAVTYYSRRSLTTTTDPL